MMTKIQNIVFDLGGVLVDWNPAYLYRKLFQSEQEMNLFFEQICTSDWNEEQDGGRLLQDGTDLLVKQFPLQESLIRAYYDRWEEMLGGPISGTVDLFREIKKKPALKTFALTNWSAETFPKALLRYDFLHWFDGRVVSGEEKTRKPFQRIYEILIDRYQIDPRR
ncbi:MAG: HAD family hydrolase, partial [Chitinophagaceae bacterium]